MKQFIISIFLFLGTYINLSAQNLITLQSGNNSTFFQTLDDAVSQAQNGDTIYIPGGSFSLSNPINKSLHLVGSGHNPDSTLTTARTIMPGLTLTSGSGNGSISGIYFTGSSFYNYGQIFFNADITGYAISRCYIKGGISNLSGTNVNNISIIENTIGSFELCLSCGNPYSINLSASNHLIDNNILLSKVNVSNSIIKNNIFLYYNGFAAIPYPLITNSCTVENNIFVGGTIGATGCIFHNNVNGGVNGVDNYSNQGSGNFLNGGSLDQIFVNYDLGLNWNYSYNLHLVSGSPYHNAGTDGTDIGIYGGIFPWKEGSVPFNPHINLKLISPTTDNQGNLPIQIRVRAQNN